MSRTVTLSQFLTWSVPSSAAPVLGALSIGAAEFSGVRYHVPSDYLVRELRGSRMRTVAGVFDEFAAAFQFPYYFGQNKDAFDECLRDLSEFVGPAPGYVAAIRNSDELLADQPAERPWFNEAMQDCATYLTAHQVMFRVVLQGAPPVIQPLILN